VKLESNQGVGFTAQLSFALQKGLNWKVSYGSGGTRAIQSLVERMKENPQWKSKLKMIVWVFKGSDFSKGMEAFEGVQYF